MHNLHGMGGVGVEEVLLGRNVGRGGTRQTLKGSAPGVACPKQQQNDVGKVGAGKRSDPTGGEKAVAKKKVSSKFIVTAKGKKIFNPYAKA